MKLVPQLAWAAVLMTTISCGAANPSTTPAGSPAGTTPPKTPADGTKTASTQVGNPSDPGATVETVVAEEKPGDSSGVAASVSLGFDALAGLGLMLTDDAALATTVPLTPPSLKIGDVELSYAKFNVASIKVKASKEQSEVEKTLDQTVTAEQKAAATDVESATGDTEAAATTASLVDGKPADKGGMPSGAVSDTKPATSPTAKPADGGGKGHKDKKKDQLAKLKGKLDDLKSKAKAALDKDSKRDLSTKFSGPYVYDAVLGKLEGDAPKVDLTDGSYKRIEFQLKPDFAAADTDPLLGNVFAMKGTVLVGGKAVPLTIEWHVALNFRLAGDGAFSVKAGEQNGLGIGFEPAKWFEGIDWASATVDADGTIYVDKRNNHAIMSQLHKNIKASVAFGKAGADGKLKADTVAGKGEETADASDD